jgi:hypothetical protein
VLGENIDTATLTEMLQVALVDRDEFRIVERSLLDKIVKGIGTLTNGILTVDWGDTYPVIYQVEQNGKVLEGTWSNGRATEKLIK